MASELNELMDRDPADLSDRDLDEIIKYLRQQRVAVEHGLSPKKAKEAVDLSSVTNSLLSKAMVEVPQAKKVDRRM